MDFFVQNFSGCVWLACILVALIPTLEAKIAIPFAMNTSFWGQSTLGGISACAFAFLGSILPSLAIIYITRFIKNKTAGFVIFSKKYAVKIRKLEGQKNTFRKYALLCFFTALPLPLTGVWTSSLIAGISNLSPIKSFISISLGSLISCILMTIICIFFANSLTAILLISLGLIAIAMLANIFFSLIKKTTKR